MDFSAVLSSFREYEQRGNSIPFKDFLEGTGIKPSDCKLLGNSLLKIGNKTLPISKALRGIIARDPSKIGGATLWQVTATDGSKFWVLGYSASQRTLVEFDFSPITKELSLDNMGLE